MLPSFCRICPLHACAVHCANAFLHLVCFSTAFAGKPAAVEAASATTSSIAAAREPGVLKPTWAKQETAADVGFRSVGHHTTVLCPFSIWRNVHHFLCRLASRVVSTCVCTPQCFVCDRSCSSVRSGTSSGLISVLRPSARWCNGSWTWKRQPSADRCMMWCLYTLVFKPRLHA